MLALQFRSFPKVREFINKNETSDVMMKNLESGLGLASENGFNPSGRLKPLNGFVLILAPNSFDLATLNLPKILITYFFFGKKFEKRYTNSL